MAIENKFPVIVTFPQLPKDKSEQERKRYDEQLRNVIGDTFKQAFLMFNDIVNEVNE